MRNNDQLIRFLFDATTVRGEWVRLSATWQTLLERKAYPPLVQELLGQAAAAAVLLAATVAVEGSLILQIQGKGPMTLLVVQVDAGLRLRGMANWKSLPSDEARAWPLTELFTDGRLIITIEANQGERYQGIVELGEGGIAEALENYFLRSEQLLTRLWLGANTSTAGGLLIQQMPLLGTELAGTDDTWQRVSHLSATVTTDELLVLPCRELLHRLYHEETLRVFEPTRVSFRCNCSRERIETMLRGLGYAEVHQILATEQTVQVDCEFCGQHYEFDAVDAEKLFVAELNPPVGKTKH